MIQRKVASLFPMILTGTCLLIIQSSVLLAETYSPKGCRFLNEKATSSESPEIEALADQFEYRQRASWSSTNYEASKSAVEQYKTDPNSRRGYLENENSLNDPHPSYVFREGNGVTSKIVWHEILSFEQQMRFNYTSESLKQHSDALALMFKLPGGVEWYKKTLSKDIRNWLLVYDYDFYQNKMPLNVKAATDQLPDGVKTYRLPDGGRVFLRTEIYDLLIDRWASLHRPGNM